MATMSPGAARHQASKAAIGHSRLPMARRTRPMMA
jgi:hypothetical protein